jgi:glucokinase
MSASPSNYILGLDLGGSRLKAIALTSDGVELARATTPTNTGEWQRAVLACVNEMITQLGPPLAIGAAAPGLAAADECSISHMPGRLPGLEGLDWTEFLTSSTPVPVLNDAHAAMLGEVWLGAAQGVKNMILLTLGTGVGGAILCDGRLLRGHLGRAGHLGHITVDAGGPLDIVNTPGSLEDAVSNHSLGLRTKGRYTSTAELIADVTSGHPEASAIWSRTVRDLAAGIVSLINVLDPEMIVIGGGIAEAGDVLFAPLASELDRFEWRPQGHGVKISRATLGDWAGAHGAAYHALNHLPYNP